MKRTLKLCFTFKNQNKKTQLEYTIIVKIKILKN